MQLGEKFSLILTSESATMKFFACLFVLCALVASIIASSQPVIRNTKAACNIGGKSGNCCKFEEKQIWPGETYDELGECQSYLCLENFDVNINNCAFDYTGQYHYVNSDGSKSFPECCGQWMKRN